MNVLEKWQLKEVLSEDEAVLVLIELYDGANSELVYDVNARFDKRLFDLFKKFPTTKSNFNLRFCSGKCEMPFVSLNLLEDIKPQHTIPTSLYTIYVYEKNDLH